MVSENKPKFNFGDRVSTGRLGGSAVSFTVASIFRDGNGVFWYRGEAAFTAYSAENSLRICNNKQKKTVTLTRYLVRNSKGLIYWSQFRSEPYSPTTLAKVEVLKTETTEAVYEE